MEGKRTHVNKIGVMNKWKVKKHVNKIEVMNKGVMKKGGQK